MQYPPPPQHPPYQQRMSPAGPPDRTKRSIWPAVSVLTALVLIGAGLLIATWPDDSPARAADAKSSPTPSPQRTSTVGDVAWQVDAPASVPAGITDRQVTGEGAWLTSRSYVTGAPDAVKGYAPDTGKELWNIPLAGNICAVSRTQTTTGHVAVAYANGRKLASRCTEMAVIDLNRGAVAWQTSLPKERSTRGLRMSVAVSGDIAAVGWPGQGIPGGSAGYKISTGEQLWSKPPSGCAADEHAGGAVLVTVSMCGGRYKAGTRNARTGKINWHFTAPRGTSDVWIPSTAPLILALNDNPDRSEASRLVSLSPKGEVQATWKAGRTYVTGCGYTRPDCGGVVARGSTLYLATPETSDTSSTIKAFDTRTGRATWSYTPPVREVTRTLFPIQAQDGALIAYMPPTQVRGGEVHQISGGKSKLLMRREDGFSPPEADMIDTHIDAPVYFADGRLFLHDSGEYRGGGTMTMALAAE
ncbi:PQQ-binding-like beta-propeller repeat protein [Streptomyces sp. NPDC058595]|uniref:outer membrane protein assembly factor BamB family protein n=1 Tax=Streptomyces sp. NPDC058595 TaxID=3346550 RepID=UPI00365FD71D